MSMLDQLNEAARSDAPVYQEFLLRYDPHKKQIFAFYEGDEDSSYYCHIIRQMIDPEYDIEELIAGCKNNVLKLYREFDWDRFSKEQIGFFVDRDLSFWLDSPTEYGENVFVTDGYSVENYVVTPQSFMNWLKHFEGFARASIKELSSMMDEYSICMEAFDVQMMPIMAKAVVAKRHDSSVSLSGFKINDKSISFIIDQEHITFTLHADTISTKWKLTEEHNNEIDQQIETFKANINQYSVRGKWKLAFLAELGEYMRYHANRFAPSLNVEGKIKQTCSVSSHQCLSVLAPYCEVTHISERLRIFINNTYGSHCTRQSA